MQSVIVSIEIYVESATIIFVSLRFLFFYIFYFYVILFSIEKFCWYLSSCVSALLGSAPQWLCSHFIIIIFFRVTQSKSLDRTFKKSGVCRFRNRNSLTTSYTFNRSFVCLLVRFGWNCAILPSLSSSSSSAPSLSSSGLDIYRTHSGHHGKSIKYIFCIMYKLYTFSISFFPPLLPFYRFFYFYPSSHSFIVCLFSF